MKFEVLLKPLMYLDPGTGSLVLQMILAGLLGIGIAVRIFWKKIITFFNKNKEGDVQDQLDAMDEYGSGQDDL